MSYEHRIIIGERTPFADTNYIAFERIADIKLSRMLHDFELIFTKDIDFHLYETDGETEIHTDKYGDKVKYTSIDNVIMRLEANTICDAQQIHRRYKPTLAFLRTLKATTEAAGGGELIVVHYGY